MSVERGRHLQLAAIVGALMIALGASCGGLLGQAEKSPPPEPTPAGTPWHLEVLHFNDFHGHLEPPGGSGARLATLVSRARGESRTRAVPSVLLFAGDASQECGLSGSTKGGTDAAFFNDLGMTASTLGNHQFDFGLDAFLIARQTSRFPYLSANVIRVDTGVPLVEPGTRLDLTAQGGPTVAIVGLTTPDTPSTSRRENVAGLAFTDPIEAARAQFSRPEMAEADLRIVLSHLGFEGDCRVSCALGNVDLIVGGHNHYAFESARTGGHAPIVQAGDDGRYLGRVEMEGVGRKVTSFQSGLLAATADVPEDPAVKGKIDEQRKVLPPADEETVGILEKGLDGRQESVRRRETNFGDLLADLIRERMAADFAILNGGAIRNSIDAGPVTRGTIQCALPFSDRLVVLPLTGAQIRWLIERSASLNPLDNPGGFLQISGARAKIEGERLVSLTATDGKPLDDARSYRVATTRFLAEGGDGYAVLRTIPPVRDVTLPLAQLLVDRMKAGGTLPESDGRIAMTGRPGLGDEVPQACVCRQQPEGR